MMQPVLVGIGYVSAWPLSVICMFVLVHIGKRLIRRFRSFCS